MKPLEKNLKLFVTLPLKKNTTHNITSSSTTQNEKSKVLWLFHWRNEETEWLMSFFQRRNWKMQTWINYWKRVKTNPVSYLKSNNILWSKKIKMKWDGYLSWKVDWPLNHAVSRFYPNLFRCSVVTIYYTALIVWFFRNLFNLFQQSIWNEM